MLRNSWRMKYLIFGFVLVVVPELLGVTSFSPGPWRSGHATFYENANGGACGYDNPSTNGYGTATTAASTPLFSNGNACGQCFQLKCSGSKWCFPFVPAITVTVTNLCPPNWYQPSNAGGWCNPPNLHFDLAKPSFMKFAFWKAGIVPVNFRRVPCSRKGGIRFKFQGNPNWLLVYVMNVGGSGDVANMWVKGTRTGWIKMTRNWGAAFQAFSMLGGQALSFKIQSGSSQTIIAYNVAPSYWSGGQTYQAAVNFK